MRWRHLGGAPLSPLTLPDGATHRSNGRGVDADAGQGNVLRGSNRRTPGCLTVSSKQESTQIQSMIQRKSTVTYVTKSNQCRRQPLAHQPHVLAWHALTAILVDLLAVSCFRPSAIPGPESLTLRTRSATQWTLHATDCGCNLTVRLFMPGSPPRCPQPRSERAGCPVPGRDDPSQSGREWRSRVSRFEQ